MPLCSRSTPALPRPRLPATAGMLLVSLACLAQPVVASAAASEPSPDFGSLFQQGFDGEFAGTPPAQTQAAPTGDPRAGVPFQRSRSVTSNVERGLAENLAENFTVRFVMDDPARFLRSGKAREVAVREMKSRGYPEDTVAGPTAVLFAVAWELANGQTLSGEDNAAILRQTIAAMRGDPLERQSDAQRQTQADVRLLTAGLWLEEAYLREPFPAQKQTLSDAVHRDIQTMSNNDMRAMMVTDEGFVKRP